MRSAAGIALKNRIVHGEDVHNPQFRCILRGALHSLADESQAIRNIASNVMLSLEWLHCMTPFMARTAALTDVGARPEQGAPARGAFAALTPYL